MARLAAVVSLAIFCSWTAVQARVPDRASPSRPDPVVGEKCRTVTTRQLITGDVQRSVEVQDVNAMLRDAERLVDSRSSVDQRTPVPQRTVRVAIETTESDCPDHAHPASVRIESCGMNSLDASYELERYWVKRSGGEWKLVEHHETLVDHCVID